MGRNARNAREDREEDGRSVTVARMRKTQIWMNPENERTRCEHHAARRSTNHRAACTSELNYENELITSPRRESDQDHLKLAEGL